jgi:outer membrane protein assembly factor BamB
MADGVIYVGSANGKMYALDAATGKVLWSYATGGFMVFQLKLSIQVLNAVHLSSAQLELG